MLKIRTEKIPDYIQKSELYSTLVNMQDEESSESSDENGSNDQPQTISIPKQYYFKKLYVNEKKLKIKDRNDMVNLLEIIRYWGSDLKPWCILDFVLEKERNYYGIFDKFSEMEYVQEKNVYLQIVLTKKNYLQKSLVMIIWIC